MGYDRYEGLEALELLRRIYGLTRVWINGWPPLMKLEGKEPGIRGSG